jgi:hypothetical protein
VFLYGVPQDLVVAGQGDLHGRGVSLPHLGGTLYVGEQKGESACGWAGHDTLMSSLLPLRGHYSSGRFPEPSVRQTSTSGSSMKSGGGSVLGKVENLMVLLLKLYT